MPHDHHDHDHAHHEHSHGPGGHHHAPANFGKAFAIGIILNLAYIAGEVFYGLLAHSLALVADAGHNLSDVLGLGGAWAAAVLSKRQPSGRYTYGLRRSSILSALGNALILLIVTGGIVWEAIRRLADPQPAGGATIIAVALAGVVVNGITALLFMSGRKDDLNIRGAFLHMASDAVLTFAVAVSGAIILLTGWLWLDPVVSILVSLVIVIGTWSLLRDSTAMALDAVPAGIDQTAVTEFLKHLPGVTDVHHLHIWSLSTTETALTAHLVQPQGSVDDLIRHAATELKEHFNIGHSTLQVERSHDAHTAPAAEGQAV